MRYRRWVKPILLFLLVLGLSLIPQTLLLPGKATDAPLAISANLTSSSAQLSAAPTELLQRGKQAYDAGRFTDAVNHFQEAIAFYTDRDEGTQQAQALGFASLAYQKLGQWQQAESAIATSLSLLNSNEPGEISIQAQILNAQGHLHLAKGDPTAALESWQRAETLYAAIDDATGALGVQLNQVYALQSSGLYRRAEKQLARVEQQLMALPDSALKSVGLRNLGLVRLQTGQLKQAQALFTQGLELAQRLQLVEEQSQALLSLGNTNRAIAQWASDLGDGETAQASNQVALSNYQQASSITAASITRLLAQVNHLSLLVAMQQISQAQELWNQMISTLVDLPDSRPSVYAYVNLAQSLIRLHGESGITASSNLSFNLKQNIDSSYLANLPLAAQVNYLLQHAAQAADSLHDLRAKSYALGSLGHLFEQTQNLEVAQQVTVQALQIAQSIQASDLMYQWQWQMGRSLQAQAEQSLREPVASSAAIGYYTEAVKILKQLRSDLITLSPDIQFSFRESVEPIYRQLVDLLLKDPHPSQDTLKQARSVIEALQLAELDNFFRDACAEAEPVAIDHLDPTAAIVYPILLPDRLEVVLKLPGNSDLKRYAHPGITTQQVDNAVEQLQIALQQQSASLSQIKSLSQQVYDWLIRPFEADLVDSGRVKTRTLVFVLDGSLRNIPPAVLHNGQQFLVERFAVAVTPSLQLLDPKPLQRQRLNVLLAGAADAPSFQQEGLEPIDNVEVELSEIANQINSTQTLKNQKFVQEVIRTKVSSTDFNVVHIATHGQFSSNPEQTFILDWQERIQVKDLDTLLQSTRSDKASPIELLILSACETAMGDRRAALGLAGVAIRAGARSTLATLYQVNDASTAEFMIRFYQQLSNPNITKAEALRQAQLALLKEYPETDYHRPYHWAPFILVGNWL